MAKSKTTPGRISIIISGINKLYNTNPKFSWFLIVVSFLGAIPNLSSEEKSATNNTAESFTASSGDYVALAILFSVLFVLAIVIGILIQGMISYATYQAINGKTPSIKESWQASKGKFWVLLEVSIWAALKIIGGLLLLIVPGIRALCRYNMAYIAVFDQKDASAKEIMSFSKAQTKDNLLIIFILTIASAIILPLSSFIRYGGQVGIYPYLKAKMPKQA